MPEPAIRAAMRSPKGAAVAGIAFAVLLTISQVLIILAIPHDARSAGELVLDDTQRRWVAIAVNLLPFAGIAFLWFIGVVRDRIGDQEDRMFATVFLGSGLLYVAMLFAAGAIAASLLVAPDAEPDPETWALGRRITYSLMTVYGMRMAGVFMTSTTTLALRLGLISWRLAAFGYVGALALLLALERLAWISLVFPLWVVVLSVDILVARRREDHRVPTPAG